MRPALLVTIDRDIYIFGRNATHFCESKQQCPVLIALLAVSTAAAFQKLCFIARGSVEGLLFEIIATGRDRMGTTCSLKWNIPVSNLTMNNVLTSGGVASLLMTLKWAPRVHQQTRQRSQLSLHPCQICSRPICETSWGSSGCCGAI